MTSIFKRRSVRRYTDQKVEKEKIESLLRAAMQAPSACNQQPWEFIVVEDKQTVEQLSKFSPYARMLLEAPLAIIILEKTTDLIAPAFTQQDLGACTQNLLLQAVEEKLGAVWLGVSKGDDREKFIVDMFNIPTEFRPFGVISVGYPMDADANSFVDRYDEKRVHYGSF